MLDALLQSAPWWAWAGFHALVLLMLALDLGVFNRRVHAPSVREAGAWSAAWITLALLFNGAVLCGEGLVTGTEWLTGYLLEKSLSVDNLFVFLMLFSAFHVDLKHQHRILHWGILGALVMRASVILAGAALLNHFEWMVYVFGAFLIYAGLKMFVVEERRPDFRQGRMVKILERTLPFAPDGGHERFLIRRSDGRLLLTPMFLVLVVVEITDLIFAVDSIPAVFAVTRDPFVVYTSNIFAILGLRSLYFLLAKMTDRFHRLKLGLAIILAFAGIKMCVAWRLQISIFVSLCFILVVLLACAAASLAWPAKIRQNNAGDGD